MSRRCRRKRLGHWRRLAGFALILPMLLALLTPAGLMPVQDRDGTFVMVLCSGDGPILMTMDPRTGELGQTPAPQKQSGCDWAMTQAVSVAGASSDAAQPIRLEQRAEPVLCVQLWRPVYDPLCVWARGPPSLI